MKWLTAWSHDGAPVPPHGEEISELRAELVQVMPSGDMKSLGLVLFAQGRPLAQVLGWELTAPCPHSRPSAPPFPLNSALSTCLVSI